MSNQNLVPRDNGSGSLGTTLKRWGTGYFKALDVENLSIGTFDAGTQSGSFEGDFSGSFQGNGSGLTDVPSERKFYKLVQSKSDFPAPTSSIITLKDNTVYEINGTVNIGTDRILYGSGSNIIGRNRPDTIVYQGSGSALTSFNNEIRMYRVNVEAPNGTGFDFHGDGSNFLAFHLVGIVDCKYIGNVTNFNGSLMQFSRFSGKSGSRSDNGIIFSGSNMNHITIDTSVFEYFSDTANVVELASNLHAKGGAIGLSVFLDGSNAVAIKVGENVTIDNQFTVVANNFFHDAPNPNVITGSAASGSIGVGHPDWLFRSNSGVQDSAPTANYYIPSSSTALQTTITAQNTPVKVNATTVAKPTIQLFTHSNNRITYTGKRKVTLDLLANLSLSAPNNNQSYRITIAKNGTIVPGTWTLVGANTSGVIYPATVMGSTEVDTGDYIEIYVENRTGTANVTVHSLSVVAIRA